VVGDEVVGSDLKPGFVALLDEELVATPGRKGAKSDEEGFSRADSKPNGGATYYRRMAEINEPYSDLEDDMPWEDHWLKQERPTGHLPWESKNPVSPAVRRGSNVNGLVGATGFEPVTARL
jgi:hypothetical protein